MNVCRVAWHGMVLWRSLCSGGDSFVANMFFQGSIEC